jgi:poly(3-hydroxyalkanoate) synthetase
MRLLSQNKNIDIAYGSNTIVKLLTKLHNECCAVSACVGGALYVTIASYSKEEYGMKALENMRDSYSNSQCIYFVFPSEEQIIEQINKEKELTIENINKIHYKG